MAHFTYKASDVKRYVVVQGVEVLIDMSANETGTLTLAEGLYKHINSTLDAATSFRQEQLLEDGVIGYADDMFWAVIGELVFTVYLEE